MFTMTQHRTRVLLRFNAITSSAAGLCCLLFADWVQVTLIPGAPQWMLIAVGAGLVGFAAYVLWVASKQQISRGHLKDIFILDAGWIVASLLIAIWMPQAFTMAGLMVWAGAALMVLDYAFLEALALKQSKAV